MLSTELENLVLALRTHQADPQTVACVPARQEAPEEIYNLVSSFANQDEGGVVAFGVDEQADYEPVGVYAVLDLRQAIADQCAQMSPCVDPVFTVATVDGKRVVSAKIPAVEAALRPCYYAGKGPELGSFKRAGYMVEPMSAYELYSFSADAERVHDDARPLDDMPQDALDTELVSSHLGALRASRPNLAPLTDAQLLALTGLERDGAPTLAELVLFGRYPQASHGQLCIVASRIQGGVRRRRLCDRDPGRHQTHRGHGSRNARGGPGLRPERPPVTKTRPSASPFRRQPCERPCSTPWSTATTACTEAIPVQLVVRTGSIEVVNPGGLFGGTRIDQLGSAWCDRRNTTLAAALTTLGLTQGTQGGLTAMAAAMDEAGCPEPESGATAPTSASRSTPAPPPRPSTTWPTTPKRCSPSAPPPAAAPRSPSSFGLSSVAYVTNHYIMPAVEKGLLYVAARQAPQQEPALHHRSVDQAQASGRGRPVCGGRPRPLFVGGTGRKPCGTQSCSALGLRPAWTIPQPQTRPTVRQPAFCAAI